MGAIISLGTESVVADFGSGGLVLKNLPPGAVYSGAVRVDLEIAGAGLTSVKVYFQKGTANSVSLKFGITYLDTSAVPATPRTVAETAFASYSLVGSSGQLNTISVPSEILATFIEIETGDSLAITIEREGSDDDDFEIMRIDFELVVPTNAVYETMRFN